MRLPERVINDNIEAQQDEGKTLRVNADKIVQALRDEGWHLVSTPEHEVSIPERHYPDQMLRVRVVVDGEILSGEHIVPAGQLAFADNPGGIRDYYKATLTHRMASALARRLRLGEWPV